VGSGGDQATFSTSALTAGSHTITAVYSGDSNYGSSTSAGVTESIQTGFMSDPSLGGPNNSMSSMDGTDSGMMGSGSGAPAAGGMVTGLFNGQLYTQAGIPTQLSSAPATTSATTTPTSANTPATPPQGPLDANSSNVSISGSYQKHYTEWGSNSFASYYLDVSANSTFGPSGESGTVTYTAFLEVNGNLLVNDTNVIVPFSNSGAPDDVLGNLPASGEAFLYGAGNFGFTDYTWDQMHYLESASYNATGTYTGANGSSYSIAQNSSITSWWNSTRVYTDDGTGTGSGTAVYSTAFGNTWKFDLSVSDLPGNFSSNTQYGNNGLPTDMFAAPASGTTFLARVFDGGSAGGSVTNTWSVVNGVDNALSASEWHSSYSGVSGSRYYYSNTASLSDSTGANTDTVTWNVNQQATDNYGGSQDNSLTYNGTSATGTVTVGANGNGQSSSSVSMTDVYKRNNNGIQGSGTFQVTTNDLSPRTYNNRTTERQAYSAGALTADSLAYNNGSGSATIQTISNSDSYTATTPQGTTTGSDYNVNSVIASSTNTAFGTLDLLANTATATVTNRSGGGSLTVGFATATYTSADSLVTASATSLLITTATNYGYSAIVGGFDASGKQTSGTLYIYSRNGGTISGFVSSRFEETCYPTSNTTQTVAGSYSGNSTIDLTINSDGSARGTIRSNSNSVLTTDTTITLKGTETLADGTDDYNNRNHSNDLYRTSSNVNLTLTSPGTVTGTIRQAAHDKVTWDYTLSITQNRNGDVLDGTTTGNGSGSTGTDDTITGTLGTTSTWTRTVEFTQKGNTSGNVSAHGSLQDDHGHTGSWTFNGGTWGNVNDSVTINLGASGNAAMTETGRRFSINENSGSNSTYHEDDNGIGAPGGMGPAFSSSYSHWVDVTGNDRHSDIENGTPTNNTFTITNFSHRGTEESNIAHVANTATGDGWDSTSFNRSTRDTTDNETGTEVNGQRTLSNLLVLHRTLQDGWQNGYYYSPVGHTYSHNRYDNRYTLLRDGSVGPGGSGIGFRSTDTWSANWGTITVNGVTSPVGNAAGTRTSQSLDLSWGANFRPETPWSRVGEGFWANPAVQWITQNAGNVLQIGFGLATVIGGFVTLVGSGGGAVLPAVGLWTVGVDQILTGWYNIGSPVQAMSVFEYGGYSLAQGAGASQGASQVIGVLTPIALTLGFATWGQMARRASVLRLTGAFLEGYPGYAERGLGVLTNRVIVVTERGLARLEQHLAQFGASPENAAMIQRLRAALASGGRITGADASFYLHEIYESAMMNRGLPYRFAHGYALELYGASAFSVYHPDVIAAYPQLFNSNWADFWAEMLSRGIIP
jgi:hypothetical protein